MEPALNETIMSLNLHPTDVKCAQPYLIAMNEMDSIKASIKQAKLSQRYPCGDEGIEMETTP